MELKPILDVTRSLIREGETGKALQTILSALEQEPRYAPTVRTLQVLEGNYNAVRQQELKGILSFQEAQRSYSQVSDALLAILNELEGGRVPAAATRPARWPWLAAGAVLLLLAAIAIWYFTSGKGDALTNVDCPEFRGSGPRLLIVPFKNVGQGMAKPEDVIQSRIQILSANRNFPITTQVLTGLDVTNLNADRTDGQALAERCKADMVIWGLYERSDSLYIDLRFTTLRNPGGAFETGFQAFRGLPDVQSGKMLNRLDDAIFGVCGILAMRSGNADLARTWFDKVQEKGEVVQQMEKILDDTAPK